MLRMGFPDSRANFSRKKFGERGNIFLVVAQRRNVDGDDVQAVVEILAERAFFERGAQVAIGGGDQAHVHFERFRSAEALEFALLQNAQKLHLNRGGNVADFVEEKRALVGQLEFSGLAGRRRRRTRPSRSRKVRFREDFREWRCC